MHLGITMVLVNKHLDITIFLVLILHYLLLRYEGVEFELGCLQEYFFKVKN